MKNDHTHKGTITLSLAHRVIRLGLLSLLACCLFCTALAQNANKPQKVQREPKITVPAGTLKGQVNSIISVSAGYGGSCNEAINSAASQVRLTLAAIPSKGHAAGETLSVPKSAVPRALIRDGNTAITDARGSYNIKVPPGTYKIQWDQRFNREHGWSPATNGEFGQQVTIESGKTLTVDFTVCNVKQFESYWKSYGFGVSCTPCTVLTPPGPRPPKKP
jgi:hypothetical protein